MSSGATGGGAGGGTSGGFQNLGNSNLGQITEDANSASDVKPVSIFSNDYKK
jgi:hypothetical protein